MKYKKITKYSLFTLTVILGPYIYGSIQLYFFDKELYQEFSENPIDVLYGQFLFENIINHIIFLIIFLGLYYYVFKRKKPWLLIFLKILFDYYVLNKVSRTTFKGITENEELLTRVKTKSKKNIFPNPPNKINHDDVLKKFFKNLKGIDFSQIINNSIDIKKDIASDVDGSWYAHGSTMPTIIKSFSINNYKASLDDLLQANGIDKASVKKKNKVIEYWEGDGFDIEAPPKSDGYRCVVVVNNKYVHKENLKFQKSKFTNKKHSLDWISGLEIFDGKDALKKSNPLDNVNVPLYFKEGEDEFIMIACPVQEAAIGLINKIIDLNGGNEGFESDTAKGWESLMNGGKFIIGYRPDDVAIRINKKNTSLVKQENNTNKKHVETERKKGLHKSYYKNGKLKQEGVYINKKKDGLWKYYHKNGQLDRIGYHKNGKDEGLWTFYYKSGELELQREFKNDKADGLTKFYYKSGVIKEITTYKNGKCTGPYKFFDKSGQLLREGELKNGKYDGLNKIYYESGELKGEGIFKNDKKNGFANTYYKSGQLEREGEFKNDKLHGNGKKYYPNGQIKQEYEYYYGLPVGKWKNYTESGQLIK